MSSGKVSRNSIFLRRIWGIALAAALAFLVGAGPAEAQFSGDAALPILVPSPVVFQQQSFTLGMVGLAPSQTARLNALNLGPVSSCQAAVTFLDAQANTLKQGAIGPLGSGKAASVDLDRSELSPSSGRIQLRAVATVTFVQAGSGTPTAFGYCNLVLNLEVFDKVTGATSVILTDARSLPMPLPSLQPAPRPGSAMEPR